MDFKFQNEKSNTFYFLFSAQVSHHNSNKHHFSCFVLLDNFARSMQRTHVHNNKTKLVCCLFCCHKSNFTLLCATKCTTMFSSPS